MVCHVCQLPASLLQCPICRRGACSAHTKPDPGGYRDRVWQNTNLLVCSPCADGWAADTQRLHAQAWCDFCSGVARPYYYDNHTPRCAVCDKRFCDMHGQILSHGSQWGGGTDYWIRCQEHAKSASRGWNPVGWFKRQWQSLGEPDFANLSRDDDFRNLSRDEASSKIR